MENKTIFYLALVLAVGLASCDSGYDCVPCGQRPFDCVIVPPNKCPEGQRPVSRGNETLANDCPSSDFITMEVRELCNEDMCVSMDDYIECEQVDCYTVECNDTGDNK